MPQDLFYDTMREGLWLAVAISTPILVAALVTGVVIGLFQALTSVQEMTITFVPKLAVMVGVFWITMGFMTERLTDFFAVRLVPLIGSV